jgi:Ca-activated chloride channel homolog
MNRTKGILVVAGLIALVAIVLSRSQGSPRQVEPTAPGGGSGAAGQVSINVSASGTHLLRGGSGELFLDLDLSALAASDARRAPINLALVVDRSGSMAGEKLEHAKEAARGLVSRMRDGDRIAIVTYGSDVTLLVSSTEIGSSSRGSILAAIDTITDRGGTFLSGGFEAGRDEVLRQAQGGYVNRVILFSDGQANEGVTSIPGLTEMSRESLTRGVHLTTMGVGLDYNENLMTAMAEVGGGHYYFIEDSRSLASIFTRELETLLSTVAKNAVLKLTLEPGVELVELYGYAFSQNGSEISVRLPDLYGGQNQKLICKLRVPTTVEGSRALARVELGFEDVVTGHRQTAVARSEVVVTADSSSVERGQNRRVLARAEQVLISKNLNQAMESYGKGDVAASQARLQAQINASEAANRNLNDKEVTRAIGGMKSRLRGTSAAPSSSAGQALIKDGKYEAYKLAK